MVSTMYSSRSRVSRARRLWRAAVWELSKVDWKAMAWWLFIAVGLLIVSYMTGQDIDHGLVHG